LEKDRWPPLDWRKKMLNIFMALLFVMLSIINYRMKKDISSPSFIFSSVWAIYILLFSLSSNIFHEISFATFGVYFIGAFVFSLGEISGEVFNWNKHLNIGEKNESIELNIENKNNIYKKENLILIVMLLILLCALPFYYKYTVGFSGASLLDINTFFYQVRVASLEAAASGPGQFGIITNLVPLALIFSVYSYNIYKKNKGKKVFVYLIIGVGIIYQLLTGGRAGAIYMILSLVGVEIISERKIKLKNIIILGVPLLFVTTFIAYFIGKGSVDNTQPFLQNINAFYNDIIIYLLGGMAAFNNVVTYEGSIASNGGVARFFLQTASSLGFNVHIPNLNMQFTTVGPGIVTNVYTIYSYYYIDYGIIGTCLFMFLLGLTSSFIYKRAKSGSDLFRVLYGFFIGGIILSVYNEQFYTNLNFLIKTIIVVWGIEFIKKIRILKNTAIERKFKCVENSSIYRRN